MTADTSEWGLETLIVRAMTGDRTGALLPGRATREEPEPFGGAGWIAGHPQDYDREYAVDTAQLTAFLRATQPEVAEALDLDHDGPVRRQFLARLQGEVTRRGVINLLRKGLKQGRHSLDLFYGTPSPGNPKAAERFAANGFSVTRQLRYSRDETRRPLDLDPFINGLPIATFALKNNLPKQTVQDAVEQYCREQRMPWKTPFTRIWKRRTRQGDFHPALLRIMSGDSAKLMGALLKKETQSELKKEVTECHT